MIDPVDTTVDRDIAVINELGLKLVYALNTHCHADHITGTGVLKTKVPDVRSVIARTSLAKADILLEKGDRIRVGNLYLEVILFY